MRKTKLVLALSFTIVALSFPEYKKDPFIYSQSCMISSGNDCTQKSVVLQNPRLRAVNVGINCGNENEVSRFTIPAGVRLEMLLSLDVSIPKTRKCEMMEYWYEL